ncbi:Spy/CpxP family protein refolding chaperone [Shewanella sp. NIFS-20-20]|uniref:Spy/CpxP family protein refolding chaperone n=1 Tax=Shewanella sp. NIFS-20-20 TaxID=2853806 RepID=UPI001C457DDD|nr:Spy/CpxP family protein refolding chaperone [Shewanella sp. NIFS-20-20]MBV7317525.1 Spy/CpxP family protein refolding chaperone [Shewanella sp. NIFS-20-20]
MKARTMLLLVASAYFSATAMAKDTGEGSSDHQVRHQKKHHQSHGCDVMDGKGMHKMFKRLDLSDEQRQQLKQLMKQSRTDDQAKARSQMRADNRQAMSDLVTAPQFDEGAAKALLAKQAEFRQQRALNNLRLRHQAYQMLTPEQQQKWQQRMDKCQKNR